MPADGPAAEPVAEWRFPNRATPPGSSAYYSVWVAPAELRDDLAAVLAWRHEVRGVLERVSDPGVARVKLEWWREELARTAEGQPRHPLSQALAPVIGCHGLPTAPFLSMTDQAQAELAGHSAANRDAFEAACESDLGALFEILARCHGVTDDAALAAARGLGAFCGMVYLIRDSGRLLRRGRPFLPADRLVQMGLTPSVLAHPDHQDELPAILAEAASDALLYRERSAGPRLPASLRARGSILDGLLSALEAEGFDLSAGRVGLTPLRKLWLAWREARRGP